MALQTHRVLFIPELLDIVFSFVDKDANITNACVCKRWSDIALDVVWKDVDDLIHLFRLLKPISRHEDALEYYFDALPEASDWSRFEKYASRVRSFKFRPSKYDLEILPLLDDIARTRTSLEILPNMHTLEWIYTTSAYMERCILFLHRRLKRLTVTAPSQAHPRPDFYTDLCARAPHLHTLTLLIDFPGNPIDAELRSSKRSSYPSFITRPPSSRNSLGPKALPTSTSSQDLKLGYGNPANVASFNPILEEGAFPCLRALNLSVRIDHLDSFFRSIFAPTHLTTLYVNSYTNHTPNEVHTFFVTLSEQCQRLSKLHVQLYHKILPFHLPTDQQLSYDTIKPLLTLTTLTTFELVHKYPLQITLDEIEDLASKWPHLEHLVLNAEPLFLEHDAFTLDLRALLPFARHCPRLRLLGLYIDADAELPSSMTPLQPFATLKALAFGTSDVHDTSAAATFLSRVCPPRCVVDMGITWTEFGSEEHRILPTHLRFALQDRCAAWQAVGKLLPALIQLRLEEKERSRALQEEVEDLRVRNQLLMDKADTKAKDTCVIA
ncbi:hypothetical protein JVU11DRAFT_6806 [Chiua virens]|nr:hypothetical protein JVU11DRAFT_6806 [Chiua virens]